MIQSSRASDMEMAGLLSAWWSNDRLMTYKLVSYNKILSYPVTGLRSLIWLGGLAAWPYHRLVSRQIVIPGSSYTIVLHTIWRSMLGTDYTIQYSCHSSYPIAVILQLSHHISSGPLHPYPDQMIQLTLAHAELLVSCARPWCRRHDLAAELEVKGIFVKNGNGRFGLPALRCWAHHRAFSAPCRRCQIGNMICI